MGAAPSCRRPCNGLDPEPVTLRAAVKQTRNYPEIGLMRGDGRALPFASDAVDFVLSSPMLHHFSEDDVIDLLRGWSRVARRAIIVCDLVRHPVAYHGILLVTKALTRNIMTRNDGPLSVQRAFTLDEWRDLFERAGIGPFRLFPKFPFRQMTLFSIQERKSAAGCAKIKTIIKGWPGHRRLIVTLIRPECNSDSPQSANDHQ